MGSPTFCIEGYDLRPLKDELVLVVKVNGASIRITSVVDPANSQWDLVNQSDVDAINKALFPETHQ